MTDLSCEAGEVVPLVPGSVAVVEAVLEDEVVTQLLVVAELVPHQSQLSILISDQSQRSIITWSRTTTSSGFVIELSSAITRWLSSTGVSLMFLNIGQVLVNVLDIVLWIVWIL